MTLLKEERITIHLTSLSIIAFSQKIKNKNLDSLIFYRVKETNKKKRKENNLSVLLRDVVFLVADTNNGKIIMIESVLRLMDI